MQQKKKYKILKIEINNGNSDIGPSLSQSVSIKIFQYPQETLKTNSHRQISCEPLKVSNDVNNYRLVCLYEKTGYYQETLEYLVYSHSINQNFDGFENEIDEFRTNYAYDESGFRIYKVNDTYARCLNRNFLTGIILKKNNNGKNEITKVFESSNIYKFSADSNLFSYSNKLRFTAEKVNFMNKNDIYYFQINKETSSNYLMLYDYKESEITKILGYYNVNNDYIILVYQTINQIEDISTKYIKYFTLKNNNAIYNIGNLFYNINIKTYEHIEYNMNDLITDVSNLGILNVNSITRNTSNIVTTEIFGTDFYDLFMNNNIFIPEKSMKTWYRYNFSFIEHAENNYTRIYYLTYVSIVVSTCKSFSCTSCWNDYNQCDTCTNNNNYGLLVDDNTKCYPKNLLVKGYIYKQSSRKFEKCYLSCEFCSDSSTDSSNHECESCTEGYLFSYEKPGNCYAINNLQIEDEKKVNNGNFISSSCNNNKILSNGECIDICPETNIYYSFEYDINTSNYQKNIINSPKYLFNKKCYDECPINSNYDSLNKICKCEYAFHINNEETTCYSDLNCMPDYPYKNLDTNQCYSSLNDCDYFFNNDCFNNCPNGKILLSTKNEEIQNYFLMELSLDNSLKNKLCICDITNGVWNKINSTNEIFLQECLNQCPEGYEPETITNKCIIIKAPTTIITTQPLTTIITTQPLTTIITTQPLTTIITTQPLTTIITTQPLTTIISTQPLITIIATQPLTTIITTQPLRTIITTQPLRTIITTQPLTTIITTQPLTTIITTQPLSTIISTQPFSTIITTQPFSTIITTQPLSTIISTRPFSTITSTQSLSTIITTQPLSTIITTQPLSTIIITQPLSTIITKDASITEQSSYKNIITEELNDMTNINENKIPELFYKDQDNCRVIYNNKCYLQCPDGTCIDQNDPQLAKCIQIQKNSKIFNGICFNNLEKITENIKSISENNEIITNDNGIIIRGYSTKSDNNMELEAKYSQIDLGDCENKIKEYYNLKENTELFILGIDSPNKNKNSSVSVYNYEIYLENGTKLEHTIPCKDVKITISSAITDLDLIKLNEALYFNDLGYDIYNINDSFYNDNCAPASINGSDITLSDRKEDFYPSNISLCNESCSYSSINFTTKRFTCECDNVYNFSEKYNKEENKEEEDISYLNYFLSLINYKIIVCYELFFDFKSYYYNAGFYIAVGNLILCLFLIFIFLECGMTTIKKQILYNIPNKHKLKEAIKEQRKKRQELLKLQLNNIHIPPKKKRKKKRINFKDISNSDRSLNNYKKSDEFRKDSFENINKVINIKQLNNNNNINNENENEGDRMKKKRKTYILKNDQQLSIAKKFSLFRKRNSKSKTNIYKKRKSTNKNLIIIPMNDEERKKQISKNEKKRLSLKNIIIITGKTFSNKNKTENDFHDLVNYINNDDQVNKKEINNVPFTQALRIDKRNYMQMFLSVLAHEIEIINIFYYKNIYTHLSITLSIYIFELCLDLNLNCLLYTDDVISKKYHNNGSIGFFTSLALSFMSNIFASIIAFIVGKLADFENIMESMTKDVVIKKQYFLNIIRFKKYLAIKLTGFYIIQTIINLGMCYYLMIFCTVYHKTQGSIMINYIIGIAESLAISFGLTIITSLLRILSIKYKWKSIYNTSKYFFENL